MLTYYHKLNIRRPVKMEEEPITVINLINKDQSVVPTRTPMAIVLYSDVSY